MRKIIDKIAILTLMVCFSSCVENETQTPKATFNIDSQTFQVNESLELHFTGVADQVVVYPGDDMHQYELRDQSNTGFVVNKNLFTYAYESPGTYKLVCIASCYIDLAKELIRDTCSVMIRVVDDCKEINRLSCPQILYDDGFAERAGSVWFFCLPT